MDPSVTKVSYTFKVLKLVGPWLSWQDWRELEKVNNEAIREWCHSDSAVISLFGLWQERTKSLAEIAHQLWDLHNWSYRPPNYYTNNQIPTFVGLFVNDSVDDGGSLVHLDPTVEFALYRSSLELSDLEEKIAENAMHEDGSRVKSVCLPMKGGDRWLLITSSYRKLEDSIPPYYFLDHTAPSRLKIVLHVDGGVSWTNETIEAIGKAAAWRLSGLIVYGSASVLSQVLISLVSALRDHVEGKYSPLEILALHQLPSRSESTDLRYERAKGALRDQFHLLQMRNLKYLNMSGYGSGHFSSDTGLEYLPFACPNLQVLDVGDYYRQQNRNCYKFLHCSSPSCWPDDDFGPHNLVLLDGVHCFLKWKMFPSVTGILLTQHDCCRMEDVTTSLRNGLFPSLTVLLCDVMRCDTYTMGETYYRPFPFTTKEQEVQGLIDALAIGCPYLRFLQFSLEDLYACRGTACNGLLQKLLFLVVFCHSLEPVIDRSLFPTNCDLRVLTIHCFDIYNIQSCLEQFLNIVDGCFPKLENLNVIYSTRQQSSGKWGTLKEIFSQRLIGLSIYHRNFPYFKEEEGAVVNGVDGFGEGGGDDDWFYDEFDDGLMLA